MGLLGSGRAKQGLVQLRGHAQVSSSQIDHDLGVFQKDKGPVPKGIEVLGAGDPSVKPSEAMA